MMLIILYAIVCLYFPISLFIDEKQRENERKERRKQEEKLFEIRTKILMNTCK